MSESVFQKVAAIIADQKNISAESITLKTTFKELEIDSLEALSLIYDFEDAFNVELPNEEAVTVQTVGDVVVSLERLGVAA